MSKLERYQVELNDEIKDRRWGRTIGLGFMAIAGAGVWTIATGEAFGVLPAVAGVCLAAAQFEEAGQSSIVINELRSQITNLTS